MSEERKAAAVFCSASYEIDPKFNDAARAVVRILSRNGYGIVSGGTVKGTMGVLADEAVKAGAGHVGIIPRFMEEVVHPGLTEVIWTDLMSARKDLMREKGHSLAIALPGGIGTMDELIETLTLAKLGRYHGRVFALNLDGFYDPLVALLDHFVQTGMLDARSRALIAFPRTPEEFEAML